MITKSKFINSRSIIKSGTVICCVIIFLSSCVNTKNATYFNGLQDTLISSDAPLPEAVIQMNDLLSISVSSLNPEATLIFNTPNSPTSGTANSLSSGYLVGTDGSIQFPVLGTIMAKGLTKTQLKEKITKSLLDKKLLIDPNVTIRFLNFRVTVLGEVTNPTVVNVPNEKISLLEAIGLAGDMTIYAKRNNVLVIREEGTQKSVKRLDLNSQELFTSPYYYLKSNDIVYVEPNKARVAIAGRSNQLLPVIFGALSLVAIVLDRVLR
jgi:polysaccharide export outer membrane protein